MCVCVFHILIHSSADEHRLSPCVMNHVEWAWGCRYLLKVMILFLLDKYPEVELLGHRVALFLIFWGAFIMSSTAAAPIYNPHRLCTRVPLSPHPQQHLWFLVVLFMALVTSVRWYLTMDLIFISPPISEVEHLFMYLFAIFTSCVQTILKQVL